MSSYRQSHPRLSLSPYELANNRHLHQFLESNELFQSQEDAARREHVVATLDQVVKRWVRRVAWERGLGGNVLLRANAKILTFGSYRLGVYGPESDIDTLCIAPSYTSQKEDFFIVLFNILANVPEVTELHAIPNANVPLMRFKLNGISVDLLYARLSLLIIPEDLDISKQDVLRGLDDQTLASLNGCLATGQILQSMSNQENFCFTLRYIKFWAKRRGVYTHLVGFLGGVHWALLVALICRLNPHAVPSTLVSEFFETFSQWNWSNPVLLFTLDASSLDSIMSDIQVQKALMPIITPVYPYKNASYNVTKSTLRILKKEFRRGDSICKKLRMSRRDWGNLSEPYPFFLSYNTFLRIHLTASDDDKLRLWKGWVESRLRQLILKIENHFSCYVECHPNACPFVDRSLTQPHCTFFWGVREKESSSISIHQDDIEIIASQFKQLAVPCYPERSDEKIDISLVGQSQIPSFHSDCEVNFIERERYRRPAGGSRFSTSTHGLPELFIGYCEVVE